MFRTEQTAGPACVFANAQESKSPTATTQTDPKQDRDVALKLYHDVWEKVGDSFTNLESLSHWARWEYRFDSRINTSADAIRFANRMTASLKDEYTWVRSPAEVAGDSDDEADSFSGIGIGPGNVEEGVVIRSVFAGGAAEKAGLKPRDLITHIDGNAASGMPDDEVIRRIRGTRGTVVTLNVRRATEEMEFKVMREVVPTPSVTTQMLADGIGYLRMESFNQLTTVRQMRRALRQLIPQCNALVIDMRGNTGGYIDHSLACAAMFVTNSVLCTITDRVEGEQRHEVTAHFCGDLQVVKQLRLTPDLAVDKWKRCKRRWRVPADLPVAILVDSDTASAAEMFTGALMDNGRAVVVGTKTFGKGIGQTTFEMPAGSDVVVTSLHYRTPAGVWPGDAQRNRPRLKPTITVRGSGRLWAGGVEQDKQLRAACRILLGKRIR